MSKSAMNRQPDANDKTNPRQPKAAPKGIPKADKRSIFLWALLFVGVFLAYSPTFTNGFVYDDTDLILHNTLVTGQRWLDIWQDDLWAETSRGISSNYYRPLVASFFALEYLVYGQNSLGYHLDNLLLHCVAMLLLFLLARDIFTTNRAGTISAFMATALYAFHPANTQTVYWVSARGDILVAIGIFLGMYCVRKEGRFATLGMLFSAALALFSKETGALYFVLVPLHCYFFCEKETRSRRTAARLLPLVAVVAVYFILRLQAVPSLFGTKSEASFWTESDGLAARLLTVPAIWGYYLLRALFPFFLNFETGIHLFSSPSDWQFIAGTSSVVLTVLLAVRFRNTKFIRWAILFWLLSLLPFLNVFVATFESGMEHYLYLPLAALAILVAYLLPRKKTSVSLFVVLLVSFAVTDFARGKVWRDDVSLWSDAVAKTGAGCRQGWTRSRINLANAYHGLARRDIEKDENLKRAEALHREIVNQRPNFGYAWNGLAEVALDRKEYARAERNFRTAVEHRPEDYRIWNKLGGVLLEQGKYSEAKDVCEKALRLRRGYTPALISLATVRMIEGDHEEAERVLAGVPESGFRPYSNAWAIRTAIDVAKGTPTTRSATDLVMTARLLDRMTLYADEARVLEVLYRSDRIDADMLHLLAMINIVKLEEEEKGVRYLSEGLSRFPNDLRFMKDLAVAYERQDEKEKAAELLERVLRVSPNHPDAAAIKRHVSALRGGE